MNIAIYHKQDRSVFVQCSGQIEDAEEFLEFKAKIQSVLKKIEQKAISMLLLDCPLNTALIGYLLKLKENDGIEVSIYLDDKQLFKLFRSIVLDKKIKIYLMSNREEWKYV